MSAALTARTVDRAQTDGRTRANTLILFGASADSSVKGSKSSSPSSSILWAERWKQVLRTTKPKFSLFKTQITSLEYRIIELRVFLADGPPQQLPGSLRSLTCNAHACIGGL